MKPLAITLGDPAGIGSEIVFGALASLPPILPVWVFGDAALARQGPGGALGGLPAVSPAALSPSSAPRLFVDVGLSGGDQLRFGTIDPLYGRVALASIDAAVDAIEAGLCSALVTAPLHKQAISLAGSPHPGHTELLAARAGLKWYGWDYAMYFDSPRLRTALLSVHVPLSEAIAKVDADSVAALARLVDREYLRLSGSRPRIAVAGLNPHAGEGGMFGREEELIRDGVERAAAAGIRITGPHAPDTVFRACVEGVSDVVLAMYHDQGLIPVKTLAFEQSVNVTLGLPYLRCSVDHGTAFDIAGRGIANTEPMRYAIEWAAARAGAGGAVS